LLEVGVVSVNFVHSDEEGGDDPLLLLQVTALARLVDVNTKTELFKSTDYIYRSGSSRFSNWQAENAKLVKHELVVGYETIAKGIAEGIFMTVSHN
jgi:hypothetical protein